MCGVDQGNELTKAEFYEKLEQYDVPYHDWAKPAETLWDEIRTGQVKLKERYFQNKLMLTFSRHSARTSVTYADVKTYRLREEYRIFPNGLKEEFRFGDQDVLSETVMEGEDPFYTALRSLTEEAGFFAPNATLLVPSDFYYGSVKAPKKVVRLWTPPRVVRLSVAHAGTVSETYIHKFDYAATVNEFQNGEHYDSEDENGIITRVSWREVQD